MNPELSKADQVSIKLCPIAQFAKTGQHQKFDKAVAELEQFAGDSLKEHEVTLIHELHRTSRLEAINHHLQCAWDLEMMDNHRPRDVERHIATAKTLAAEIKLVLESGEKLEPGWTSDADFDQRLSRIRDHQHGTVVPEEYQFNWEEVKTVLPPVPRRRRGSYFSQR